MFIGSIMCLWISVGVIMNLMWHYNVKGIFIGLFLGKKSWPVYRVQYTLMTFLSENVAVKVLRWDSTSKRWCHWEATKVASHSDLADFSFLNRKKKWKQDCPGLIIVSIFCSILTSQGSRWPLLLLCRVMGRAYRHMMCCSTEQKPIVVVVIIHLQPCKSQACHDLCAGPCRKFL